MGIERITPISQVGAYLIASLQIVNDEIKRTLSYLGDETISKARDRSGEDSWFDKTGNLRSSIGYAIYEKGRKEIESAFKIVKNGAEGSDEGRKMIDDLAQNYANTYAMVVVAAMNYAEYVEAKDNKDVLASAELFARDKLNEYLKKALQRAEKKIAKL